jgi:N-acylneuraminate cytidylyltransferase
METKKLYTAVIPVRAGSRRLPNKNIAPFADSNLLINKIRQLKRVPKIDEIVVTSDSEEMLQMAARENVVAARRPDKYCDEKSTTFGDVVRYVCTQIESENIIWATCTAPLVTPETYASAIADYEANVLEAKTHDSLMSVEPFKRYIWDEKGPLNYELGVKHVPSQQLPQLYYVTDGILIAPRIKMIEWSYFHGVNPRRFALSKKMAVDIDDELDLACAKAWLPIGTETPQTT